MAKRTLVVLAAGMGSRFGGLKQIEPVGPNNEVLADYAVYDALRYGFERVVFIIREQHLELFKEKISDKFKDKIEVIYTFQKLENGFSDVKIPLGREKMWGTTHALLAAKDYVDGPFLMINADDFYGSSAYKKVKDFFDTNKKENEYITIGYPFKSVSSNNGKVKRGVINTLNGIVTDIKESEVEITDAGNIAYPLDKTEKFIIEDNHPVSMNFFGLKPSVFKYLEEDFDKFIHGDLDLNKECLMADTLKAKIISNDIVFYNELSDSPWFGMTYKEDVIDVKNKILELIEKGEYPENLWR